MEIRESRLVMIILGGLSGSADHFYQVNGVLGGIVWEITEAESFENELERLADRYHTIGDVSFSAQPAGNYDGKTTKTTGPRWGRIVRLFTMGSLIERKRATTDKKQRGPNDPWAAMRIGAGSRETLRPKTAPSKNIGPIVNLSRFRNGLIGAGRTQAKCRIGCPIDLLGVVFRLQQEMYTEVYLINGSYPEVF